MPSELRVKIVKEGSKQSLPIPQEFQLAGDDVILRKEGERLVVEPVNRPSLLAVLASLPNLDDEFPNIDDPLPEPVDL